MTLEEKYQKLLEFIKNNCLEFRNDIFDKEIYLIDKKTGQKIYKSEGLLIAQSILARKLLKEIGEVEE